MMNESFEFLLGKCQRVMGQELITFFFPCLFPCLYWIVRSRMIQFIKLHYFFFQPLLFPHSFSLLSSSNSLGGAIEGGWIIELIKSTLFFLFGAS